MSKISKEFKSGFIFLLAIVTLVYGLKYLKGLKFIYVDSMAEVITNALTNRKVINSKLI